MNNRNLLLSISKSDSIFVFIALILGVILRISPAIMSDFPLNDGGMFYVMVEELKENQFILPVFTRYNLNNIPYAYPPFGFYVTALLSYIFQLSTIETIRWLPPIVSSLSLIPFYLLAREILGSKTQAGIAVLFYGLSPDSYTWVIMGGGITRSFGLLFLYLTIAFANRFFKDISVRNTLFVALFGALACLSHPETGLQAAAVCLLLWVFRGRSYKSIIWSSFVVLAVAALTAPWWANVIMNHGVTPFLSAMQSSDDGTIHLAKFLLLDLGGGLFFSLTVAIGLVGLLGLLAQKDFMLPIWVLLPYFVDPRSAGGMALIPFSMLAAYGFDQLLAPALHKLRAGKGSWYSDRYINLSMFTMAFYLFLGSGIFGLGVVEKILSQEDRKTIAWVNANLPQESKFLLFTGEQYSMKDPYQEWFPALTDQQSQTTLQGLEWTLNTEFFPFYGKLVSLQHCTDVDCIISWTKDTGLEHQYILFKVFPDGSLTPLQASLRLLEKSVRASEKYELAYQTSNVIIFKNTERN